MSLIDSKYIGLISSRLSKFSKRNEDNYNFRCPYCGDSQRYKNKARGYIYKYKNDHNFKCHNCGESKSFTNFLKDFDTTLYDQYVMERYRNGLTGRGSNTKNPQFNFQEPIFTKEEKKAEVLIDINLPTISELDIDHPARKYIESRKIPKEYHTKLYYCDKFKEWTNSKKHTFNSIEYEESRIIIPLISDGIFFGFQGRSLDKNSQLKYITIILNEDYPKIYGLDSIDYKKPVYVTEGPFDSMFIDNAIAMVGADIDKAFFVSNYETNFVIIYDNEKRNKQIIDRIEKIIDLNFHVIIWPSNLPEKDINDMVLSGHDVEKVLESNTYSGLEAKVKLSNWKRV